MIAKILSQYSACDVSWKPYNTDLLFCSSKLRSREHCPINIITIQIHCRSSFPVNLKVLAFIAATWVFCDILWIYNLWTATHNCDYQNSKIHLMHHRKAGFFDLFFILIALGKHWEKLDVSLFLSNLFRSCVQLHFA